jgi:hypothetical protein
MQIVWVEVQLKPGITQDKDRVVGLWEVTLDRDLPEGQAVGAALDLFHTSVAIDVLDDYEITTIDPQTRKPIYEGEDYVQGSGPKGAVELINDTGLDDAPTP